MTINRLDLGATSYDDETDVVSIDLDGFFHTNNTACIVGDYNHCPFPSNYFDEAYGGCYFEEAYDLNELFRVLKPGAVAKLSSCEWFTMFGDDGPNQDDLVKTIINISIQASQAGFKVDVAEIEGDISEHQIYFPQFILTKPE